MIAFNFQRQIMHLEPCRSCIEEGCVKCYAWPWPDRSGKDMMKRCLRCSWKGRACSNVLKSGKQRRMPDLLEVVGLDGSR